MSRASGGLLALGAITSRYSKHIWIAAALLALVSLACVPAGGGSRSSNTTPSRTISVVTSTTVLADLIRQVGGARVRVTALVPSGADPNTFQPAARHVMTVTHADLVVFNGLGLDRTVRTLVANVSRPDLAVIALADGLPTLENRFAAPDRANPYLWLDPRNVVAYVERIREALTGIDPAGAQEYSANTETYRNRLAVLDDEVESQLVAIPLERRKLVTLHDGFPYLAKRYGFEIIGVVIKTPGREPSAREVADVSRALQRQDIRTVFTEPQLDARLLKLAARDAGINISTLYSDTLDQTVPTYEALLRYNARQLVIGLQ
jgi:manganese/iron transport system substrate-binding protein